MHLTDSSSIIHAECGITHANAVHNTVRLPNARHVGTMHSIYMLPSKLAACGHFPWRAHLQDFLDGTVVPPPPPLQAVRL
jgi:hypothetical protein